MMFFFCRFDIYLIPLVFDCCVTIIIIAYYNGKENDNKSLPKKEEIVPLVSKAQKVSVDPTVYLIVQLLNLTESLISISEL